MLQRLRRAQIARTAFPAGWLELLERCVDVYPRLSRRMQATLRTRIQVFLAEKKFVGCAGLQVTDEMRVVIAAQACRLELGRRPSFYPHCQTIYLYPSAFMSPVTQVLPGGIVHEEHMARIGESWQRGSVVLAWDAVQAASFGLTPGRNVVLHEFAHQLDGWDGAVDGVPRLEDKNSYARWQQGMKRAYLNLLSEARWGRPPIDPYAALSPAEFFAVTTELYFEDVDALCAHYPDVPDLLEGYYGLAPRSARAMTLN